jgi:hypothetical protein
MSGRVGTENKQLSTKLHEISDLIFEFQDQLKDSQFKNILDSLKTCFTLNETIGKSLSESSKKSLPVQTQPRYRCTCNDNEYKCVGIEHFSICRNRLYLCEKFTLLKVYCSFFKEYRCTHNSIFETLNFPLDSTSYNCTPKITEVSDYERQEILKESKFFTKFLNSINKNDPNCILNHLISICYLSLWFNNFICFDPSSESYKQMLLYIRSIIENDQTELQQFPSFIFGLNNPIIQFYKEYNLYFSLHYPFDDISMDEFFTPSSRTTTQTTLSTNPTSSTQSGCCYTYKRKHGSKNKGDLCGSDIYNNERKLCKLHSKSKYTNQTPTGSFSSTSR